jgi:hypothetical protein
VYEINWRKVGGLLPAITRWYSASGEDKPIPRDLAIEAAITERVSSDVSSTEAFGDRPRSHPPV